MLSGLGSLDGTGGAWCGTGPGGWSWSRSCDTYRPPPVWLLGVVGDELGGWMAFAFEASLGGVVALTLPDEDIDELVDGDVLEVSLGVLDALELLLGDDVSVDAVVVGGVVDAVEVVLEPDGVLYEVDEGFLLQPGRTDAASAVTAM